MSNFLATVYLVGVVALITDMAHRYQNLIASPIPHAAKRARVMLRSILWPLWLLGHIAIWLTFPGPDLEPTPDE